ncbi:dihydroorotate dehydrogenase [Treponema sp.]|uniref:dihydroorotate dehydrogenase n=1 Tax=Treponema sp. TaxID=166 RepID=UPI00298E8942|nr:dihydroorotate dehydrogenase [Treponema sp.]MCR5614227.1 dihydroorotate dehydrogenase [Treponema sp.]
MTKDCSGKTIPVYAKGIVSKVGTVKGAVPQDSVYSLVVKVCAKEKSLPQAGQFYMLRAEKGKTLLGRPISVYHSEVIKENADKTKDAAIEFLILKKGQGTQELCSLEAKDNVDILGPLGNVFPMPRVGKSVGASAGVSSRAGKSAGTAGAKVCIIGGGIGVAPVAGFAEKLEPKSYDFYACFKSGKYGVNKIHPAKLIVTTDDGSVGIKGMLPTALDAQKIRDKGYSVIYACGPTPMLAYVKEIAAEAGVKCYLSMESRMACGMGVCLGCTIETTEGYKRCCKDGPVFEGEKLIFTKPSAPAPQIIEARKNKKVKPDLSVKIRDVVLQNPVIGSSGTFGFGVEYKDVFDVNKLGGISSKGLTLEPRQGNTGVRLWETPSGLMNSIGLQNPGIPHFIEHELPSMLKLKPVTIANLSGSSLESYIEGAKLLDKTDVPIIELNISCPNVSTGGAALGMSCTTAAQATRAICSVTKKPVVVKLTPQATDVVGVALACIEAGAAGISLCNSFQGVAIDIEKGRPVFDKIKAGFGGPAVRPIAVRLVYEVCSAIKKLSADKQVPVIGIGGIATWQDAVEFIMAGATAVQVGTNTFANPNSMIEIVEGIKGFMARKGFKTIEDFRGCAL